MINSSKNNKKVGILLLIDFEKAYDSVWVEGLLYKLHEAGWKGKVWSIIANMLLTRKIYIRVGKYQSKELEAHLGLPQGSIIAPLLFIFYIAEMLNDTTSSNFKYADDATLYSEGTDFMEVVENMQKNCDKLFKWTIKWRFKINCQKGKTEAVAINCEHELRKKQLYIGLNEIDYVPESKILGVYVDSNLSWKRQVNSVRSKVWFAWHKIKKLTSRYKGLKMETIIHLVKIAVLPIMFYCSPVWLMNKEKYFHDIWYDIVKTATGSCCKPSEGKLEVLCSLPPLHLQVKAIIVKFLIKNFIIHDPDLLAQEIAKTSNKVNHFVHAHSNHLKDYIMFKQESGRSRHTIDLENYRFGTLGYTKTTIWNFIQAEWKKSLLQQVTEENFTGIIQQQTIKTPCNRATEVYLLQCIHKHIPLNNFLWNLGLTSSPLCDCKTTEETPNHVVFDCTELSDKRQRYNISGNSMIDFMVKLKSAKNRAELFKDFCTFLAEIKLVKKATGHKDLEKYFGTNED